MAKRKKNFIIKICGKARVSEKTNLDHVETFDAFVNDLFAHYGDALKAKFDAKMELSYDKKDEKGKLVDPYLSKFEFTGVYKDVQ
jgi:hypothetical protein